MKFQVVLLMCLCAVISLMPESSFGAYIEVPDEFISSPDYSLIDVREGARAKRDVKVEGGGGDTAGQVKVTGEKTVYDNGRTRVDGKVQGAVSWQEGLPTHKSYGAGVEVTRKLNEKGNLEGYVGYNRNWNSPDKHSYSTGIRYTF